MSAPQGHKPSGSVTQNNKAQLANAYNELGRELSSSKIRVVGNYTLGKVIGEGAYGKVRMGTHRLTSTRVAIKQIPKAMSAALTREIHHHRQLHHPHVMQMYEVIATESSIWIVTELCSGGELFDYLAEKGRLDEAETRIIFGQLCLAVAFLHERGVVHRDLKLENILLDERCRVKLGDFGFTREFDRGAFMETYCGTTGYAAPEMLECKKYLGAEVDVWSLGIILYCLLTGQLPFDDDDEAVMRDMIIKGEFEDPEWLSDAARDLIQNILKKNPSERLTISQILAHPWFTSPPPPSPRPTSLASNLASAQPSPFVPSASLDDPTPPAQAIISPQSSTSDSTFLSASSEITPSVPTTPDDGERGDPFSAPAGEGARNIFTHHNLSDRTLKKAAHDAALDTLQSGKTRARSPPETVPEEGAPDDTTPRRPRVNSSSGSMKGPPSLPVRTPMRTKRRSVSSNLSDPASPTFEKPVQTAPPQDFSALLTTPAPIIFSTPLERALLNSLSALGFDTGQIVHSVLTDACDAAGAVWWMLRRKAEKKALEEGTSLVDAEQPVTVAGAGPADRRAVGVQTDYSSAPHALNLARSAPQLAFVPPTPTVTQQPSTPPPPTLAKSPTVPYIAAASNSASDLRSSPSTPSGSTLSNQGSKGRRDGKARSGSVSIMQRANTALEAVGIVRKKSSEAIDKERERDKSKETERKASTSGEEPRSSHASSSVSHKLAKSPPPKGVPSTPAASPDLKHPQPTMDSPWVVTSVSNSASPNSDSPSRTSSPGDTLTSLPNFKDGSKVAPHRNRASLLSAFRLWFNEDRKGKRKDPSNQPPPKSAPASRNLYGRARNQSGASSAHERGGTMKRRASGNAGHGTRKSGRGHNRPSVSSRRSSSVNSRRSSGQSGQFAVLESPHLLEHIPTRRSAGSHTPNSDRGEWPSRPSSIRSVSGHRRHRKSPSVSSAGSAHYRAASPMQKYHHHRGGSGSSTRVVRQAPSGRPTHARSNSAASSIHSLASSRPGSFYEPSEGEGNGAIPRTGSPFKRRSLDEPPRRGTGGSSSSSSNTTFVAQKRQTPFASPLAASGRSSWKKSWGLEPPGWQSRAAHMPIEVLAISPEGAGPGGSLRDVFSGAGRTPPSLSLGDESDWVDEDDDVGPFAGGLGQTPTSAGGGYNDAPLTLSPPPRGMSSSKRRAGAGKAGHSPVGRDSPVQAEAAAALHKVETTEGRGGRRQLPTGRGGAERRAPVIQEEDEEEE